MKTNYVSVITNRSTNNTLGYYHLEKVRYINSTIEKDNDSIKGIGLGLLDYSCVWHYCQREITLPIESTINRVKAWGLKE